MTTFGSPAAAAAMPQQQQKAEKLRSEILAELGRDYGVDWLETPHRMLSGRTPERAIDDGDFEAVEDLLYSILCIGAT